MNTPVDYKIAKLLKEKGFDTPVDGRWYYDHEQLKYILSLKGAVKWTVDEEDSYPAPTISDVVMWLYEKHGIWIQPFILNKTFAWKAEEIKKEITWCLFSQRDKGYNSPTEAYEAAIDYCLTTLI